MNAANGNSTTTGAGVVGTTSPDSVGTTSPDSVVVVFGGVLGVTISADAAVLGVLDAVTVAGTEGVDESLWVGVAGAESVSLVSEGELSIDPVFVLTDTDVAPVVVVVFVAAAVAPPAFGAEPVESVSVLVVAVTDVGGWVVSVALCAVPVDPVFELADSEVVSLLLAPALDSSACATPAPQVNAAPTPSVNAPTPSHVVTRGCPFDSRRRRAVARACSALARFRIRCGLMNDLQCGKHRYRHPEWSPQLCGNCPVGHYLDFGPSTRATTWFRRAINSPRSTHRCGADASGCPTGSARAKGVFRVAALL
ncbi:MULTISPECIES: hypothetical protein [unclassified Mycobacterium]|uniref:hypothetical protein n=1 Tax=unclassified Mycobacterium TaxID=2642494 RepID=UPI0029C61B2C|nr:MULTISPECIES: hypothetical protein [unclassified Mycobacterium]